jgi:hypothetical protein
MEKNTSFLNFDEIFGNKLKQMPPNPGCTMNMRKKNEQSAMIQTRIKERMYNSIAQAVISIILTPYLILKLFLSLFVIIAVSISAFLVIKSFMMFFSYDVITKSRTINEMPSIFPKVTLCNNNPFQNKNAIEYLREVAQENNIDISYFFGNKTNSSYESKLNASNFLYQFAVFKMNYLYREKKCDIIRNLSHKLDDLLIGCKFNNEECNISDFSWSFHRYRGNNQYYNIKICL